jgi:hypothetical protein
VDFNALLGIDLISWSCLAGILWTPIIDLDKGMFDVKP